MKKVKYTLIRKHFCADCGAETHLRLVQKYDLAVHGIYVPVSEHTLCPVCLEIRKDESEEAHADS